RIGAASLKADASVQMHPRGHYVFLPVGFEVGLTYELQEQPVWHFSMSLPVPGRLPGPAAVRMVLGILVLPPVEECIAAENFAGVLNFWFRADDIETENLHDHLERRRQKRMERLLKPKSSGAVKRRGCHE